MPVPTQKTNPTHTQTKLSILSTATTGKRIVPVFCLIHGTDGIGKTTFAAAAPNPIFVGTETGTNQKDVTRLPSPDNYAEFLQQVHALRLEAHNYKTLVIDSLDWLEPLIWQQVCSEGNVTSIEKYEGGFGKGFTRALDFWRTIIRALQILQKRMHVILIAHSLIKKFEDPEALASYDRYIVALNEKAANLVRQAVDVVLFANYKVKVINVKEGPQGAKGKGRGSAERVMYTETRPAFDAKNRFNMPFELPLDWKVFGEHIKAFYGVKPAEPATAPAPEPPKPIAAAPPEAAPPSTVTPGDNGEIPREGETAPTAPSATPTVEKPF